MKIPDDFMEQGCFWVPHFLFRKDMGLDKQERLFLVALLAIEDEFLDLHPMKQAWFFATNRLIREKSGISLRTIPVVRHRLIKRGVLSSRRGYTGHATEYRIRFDRFYRANKEA